MSRKRKEWRADDVRLDAWAKSTNDLEPLSDALIAELVAKGWPKAQLLEFRLMGGHYQRSTGRIVGGDLRIV